MWSLILNNFRQNSSPRTKLVKWTENHLRIQEIPKLFIVLSINPNESNLIICTVELWKTSLNCFLYFGSLNCFETRILRESALNYLWWICILGLKHTIIMDSNVWKYPFIAYSEYSETVALTSSQCIRYTGSFFAIAWSGMKIITNFSETFSYSDPKKKIYV